MKVPVEKFWMVHGLGQREPTKRHATPTSAGREAARLAGSNPGVTFIVLEAIGGACKRDVQTFIFDDGVVDPFDTADEEMPF